MKTKKAQTTFEFLTTYGWALLVLVIMMSAAAYVIMSPDQVIPPSCTFTDKLQCTEHAVTTDDIQANMMNFDDRTINITSVMCEIEGQEYTTNKDPEIEVPVGQSKVVKCEEDIDLTKDDLIRATMTITYKKHGNEYNSVTQGNIIGRVIDI